MVPMIRDLLRTKVAFPLLHTISSSLTHVDSQSSLFLDVNERVISFSATNDIPILAEASLEAVRFFDHIGSALIYLSVLLARVVVSLGPDLF